MPRNINAISYICNACGAQCNSISERHVCAETDLLKTSSAVGANNLMFN